MALLKEQSAQSLMLRAEVESLRHVIAAGNVSEPVETPVRVAATMRPEYRVVPNLSLAMASFSGNETPLETDDWLEEIYDDPKSLTVRIRSAVRLNALDRSGERLVFGPRVYLLAYV